MNGAALRRTLRRGRGVDVAWIGHDVLSLSLGLPGRFDAPPFVAAVRRVVDACRAHGVAAGQMVDTPAQAVERADEGIRCPCYSGDVCSPRHDLSDTWLHSPLAGPDDGGSLFRGDAATSCPQRPALGIAVRCE